MEEVSSTDAVAVEPSPSGHGANWILFGPHGLRAGWSILLFVVIFVVANFLYRWPLQSTARNLAEMAGYGKGLPPPAIPIRFGLFSELLLAAGSVIATIAMAFFEHRPVLSYGFQGRARTIRFLSGIASGFVAISALVLVLWKAGFLSLNGQLLHGALLWKDAAGWALFFLLVAIFEESLFRGYIQYTLTRGIGFWWSALFFAFVFGFSHGSNSGETLVGLFSAAFIGLLFCLSLWYTGSLWWALGFHAAWDWGESYFYGTSDSGMVVKGHLFAEHPVGRILWSGGPTGPEGSILVLPLIGIMAFFMWLWWRKRGEQPFAGSAWKPAKPTFPIAP